MEVDGEDGSRLLLEPRSTTLFGRGSGFTSDNRTVSRRHVLFDVLTPDDQKDSQTEFRVSFEVIGRNPIWLRSGVDGEIRTFRRFSKGEMAPGDSFSVAAKSPIWFNLKKADEFVQQDERISWSKSEIGASLGNGFDFEGVDVLGIDPAKEFGFVVMGHEFDSYTRRIVRDPKKWKWFLEETRESSSSNDDKEVGKKERRDATKKRKNTTEDDDDWEGDSEEDKEMIAKARKVGTPKYRTRSKDVRKSGGKSSIQEKTSVSIEEEEEESENKADENDETLGGFIVNKDDVDEDQTKGDEGDEEEEEFTEEDDDE